MFFSGRWVKPDDRGWTSFPFFWFRCSRGDPMVNMKLIRKVIMSHPGFPGISVVKSQAAMQRMQVQYLGWEDPLENKMATHSSILAWVIPWVEEPGRLQSLGSQSRTQHSE